MLFFPRVLCSTPKSPSQSISDLQQERFRQSRHIGRSLLNMSQFLYAHCDELFGNFNLQRSGHCVNRSGTAQSLMQCPIKEDTPYFTAVHFGCFAEHCNFSVKARSIFLLNSRNSCTWQRLQKELEDGSESSGEGACTIPRHDKLQLAPAELLRHQNIVRLRFTTGSPEDYKFQRIQTSRTF